MGIRTDADSTDMHDEIDRLVANREWSEHFSGNVGNNLDPAIATADLEALRSSSDRAITWIDRRVAYSDKRAIPANDMPTLDDVRQQALGEQSQTPPACSVPERRSGPRPHCRSRPRR